MRFLLDVPAACQVVPVTAAVPVVFRIASGHGFGDEILSFEITFCGVFLPQFPEFVAVR